MNVVAESPKLGRPPKVEPESEKPLKMYKVTIHSGADKGDKGEVFLGHNYVGMLIQRDKEVIINEYYLNTLKHTTIETQIKGEDGIVRDIKIPTYSYTVEPA